MDLHNVQIASKITNVIKNDYLKKRKGLVVWLSQPLPPQ
jgi:hypothetical protein